VAQFASADELAARLGIELQGDEESRADALLSLASGLIQDAARQVIELVEDETVILRGSREGKILLPERPVVSISSVLIAGDSQDPSSYYLDRDHLARAGGGLWGDLLSPTTLGDPSEELVVTYTHGFEETPGSVKAICLEAVVRAWVNPGAVAQEGYGGERVVYPVQGLLLTSEERRTLRKLTGRRSESSALR